jgi:hypothetical protein
MSTRSQAGRLRALFRREARRTDDPLVRGWLLRLARGEGATFGVGAQVDHLEDRVSPPVGAVRVRALGNGKKG